MSRMYDRKVTVTVDGDERDVYARAWVDVETDRGSPWATLDGGPSLLLPEGWLDVADVSLGDGDLQRIEDAICEAAFDDDRDGEVDE